MKGLLLYALLALAVLSPYLKTGYYVDDAPNSLLPSYLQLRGLSLGQFIARQNRFWMFENGRLYPLALALAYGSWYWIRSLAVYRVTQVLLVLSNLFVFQALIRALGGGRRLALICGLLVLCLFQLRNYHDPVSSYSFLMQVAWTLGAGSILFFAAFRTHGRAWALAASLVLYAAALLLYETGLSFFPVLLFLAFQKLPPGLTRTGRGLARWGSTAITGLYLGGVATLRFAYPLAYNGTRSHLGLRAGVTFLRQLSGALPLVYAFFGKSGFYTFGTLLSREFLNLSTLAVFVAGSLLFLGALRAAAWDTPEPNPPEKTRHTLLILGWALLAVPTALVALSEKYQEGIDRPGMAYLPVYLSCFGVALLAGLALARTRRVKTATALFGVVLAFTYSTNQIAAEHLNAYWRYPRELVEAAFAQGLLSDVEPDARILRAETGTWNWATPEFMLASCVRTQPVGDLEEAMRDREAAPAGKIYVVVETTRGPGEGRVLLARLERVERDPKEKKIRLIHTSGPVKAFDASEGRGHLSVIAAPVLDLQRPQGP